MTLKEKNIIVGVTGGIAAYKSAELVRLLSKNGANVEVVMTESAKAFITKMTFQALTGKVVRDSLWDEAHEAAMGHIELARWADMIVIAPASANTIAKLATGQASCLLSTLILATKAAVYLCPAMNQEMFQQSITQENLARLKVRGMGVLGPGVGAQACGDDGPGRLLEPVEIIEQLGSPKLNNEPKSSPCLNGLTVMITAGPTREAVDPVRYLSNRSSGKMGFAIAEAAKALGARVLVVRGPTAAKIGDNIECYDVESARQMHEAVMARIDDTDIFIAAAAVSDYTVAEPLTHKMKKNAEDLTLHLTRTPDIVADVASLANRPFVVGFAAETHDIKEYALAKLENKGLDMIICNQVSRDDIGFDSNDNEVTVFTHRQQKAFAKQPKARLAYDLLKDIAKDYQLHHETSHSVKDSR